MQFTPFTVIAGKNASGKSNLFDALELLSRLASMNLKEAFPERRGSVTELFTLTQKGEYGTEMSFEAELLVCRTVKDNWGQTAEIKSPRLRYELGIARKPGQHGFEELTVTHERLTRIKVTDDSWAQELIPKEETRLWKNTQSGGSAKPFIDTDLTNGIPTILIRQDGKQGGKATPAKDLGQTVLAGINSVDFPHVFAVKQEMMSWRFMQLNPDQLRKPTPQDPRMSYTLTHNGANLAAALFRIKDSDPHILKDLAVDLNVLLPEFTAVDVQHEEAQRHFIIRLQTHDGREFSSRVLSEGTLRLLALMVMKYDDEHTGLLCFEEPENGVHPMRIADITDLLLDLSVNFEEPGSRLRQVIINTHSPLLVKKLSEISGDPRVSIWLSRMVKLIKPANGKPGTSMFCTAIHQVSLQGQFELAIDPASKKWNIAELTRYLETMSPVPELSDF